MHDWLDSILQRREHRESQVKHKMLPPELYKPKYHLQNTGIFLLLLCWWVLGRRITSDVRVVGFWILNYQCTFLLLQGVHCPSDLLSSLKGCSGFHFSHSHIQDMALCCQRQLWRMRQESSCRFSYVSNSKPMSPVKIKRKYKSRQCVTCF